MTQAAKMLEFDPQRNGGAQQDLRSAARAADGWDVVHRPAKPCTFPQRIDAARRELQALERELARGKAVQSPADGERSPHHAVLIELRANARMLRSAISGVGDQPRQIARLPRVVMPLDREEPRLARVAELYLRTVNGEFSAATFCTFVRELQVHDPLTVDELWSVSAFLRFALLESLLDEAKTLLRSPDTVTAPQAAIRMKSLRIVSQADWVHLMEPLILFDEALRQDPAGAYERMDFTSREQYRQRVAYLSRYSDCTELQVAQAALELAREGALRVTKEPRMQQRYRHVGYYLLDQGLPDLVTRIAFHPPMIDRVRAWVRRHGEDVYIGGIQIVTVLIAAAAILPLVQHAFAFPGLVLVLLLLLLPATQDGVELMNTAVTALFLPQRLPKLDFNKGIPEEYTTLVTVPSLLLSEAQVRDLVNNLEVRFLANRDPNLHFALLTDLADSTAQPRGRDTDPLVELAAQLIDGLNARYASPKHGSFLLLHRHRIFNRRQGVWMGWERKRGKLLELNNLLVEGQDAFPIKAGPVEVLRNVRYVLTLDSDTQLPHGTAAGLVGAMAHPLNQAVIDPTRRVVTEGYGILQPRIGITVQSASRSRLAAIYSGQTGFDIYTRAMSDAYQDLFGEGIFTGKGIYEVATFHEVLNHRFPRNALLSHDLIEGAYARAGLASDLELIDDYPSHYSAYSRRKHRWVRGDWQIAQWMFGRVPDEHGHWGPNPISSLSGWKIFDNLRRSLVEPFLFFLFIAGWLGLPGSPLYWTILPLVLLGLPYVAQLVLGLIRVASSERKTGADEVWAGFGRGMLMALLMLAFLPHQMLLALDAIVRSFVRGFITGEQLLEWETAAEAEASSTRITPVDRYLAWMPIVAVSLGVLIFFAARNRHAIFYAAPVLVLWAMVSPLTAWLNRRPSEQQNRISEGDKSYLYLHALRIWRYFHQFGEDRHNYLIPDNVEEDGLREAPRVSPTNVGLLLNARQAACEFGFITSPEFVALTQQTLSTLARMEKHRGHLYNWYDTQTLQPLDAAPFVSSVDSGNFVASLYTLRAGALEQLKQPMLRDDLLAGLRAYWQIMKQDKSAPAVSVSSPPKESDWEDWMHWLPQAETAFREARATLENPAEANWWFTETHRRVLALETLIDNYLPWLLPQYAMLRELPAFGIAKSADTVSVEDAFVLAGNLQTRLAETRDAWSHQAQLVEAAAALDLALEAARENLRALGGGLLRIAQDAERMAEDTDFSFLVDPGRQILSIGYNVREGKVHEACYDMLASEARVATFLSIARGDLPYSSWFKLSRDYAQAYGHYLLLSWTGTMFEYMMPALWMRSYPNTLLAATQDASVHVQQAFGAELGIPWGISESGAARRNDSGHYHYYAYGMPKVALWFEAISGPVVSPYSTFLSLSVDSRAALRNLRRMESADWVGAFGFYEAGDFTESTRKPEIVREWMAHHMGMSLLATLNLLKENAVQRWFHANALVQSTELLLHEMATSKAVMRAKVEEFSPGAA